MDVHIFKGVKYKDRTVQMHCLHTDLALVLLIMLSPACNTLNKLVARYDVNETPMLFKKHGTAEEKYPDKRPF